MAENNSPTNKHNPPAKDVKGERALRLVMLAVAGCLVAAGAIIAFRSPTDDAPSRKPAVSDSQLVLERADYLMKNNLHEAAIGLLTTYTRANPNDVDARLLLAQALSDTGQRTEAEQAVDDIFRSLQAPLRAKLWWLKGDLMRRRGEPAEKYMKFFASATDQPDATPEVWSKYGQILERDQPLEARAWCQRAYDAGLRDGDTLRVLGRFALDNDELDLAKELLEQAVEKEKNNPETWLLLVQTFRAMGRDDQALATAQTALQSGRPDGELLLELGELLEARGEKSQAADAYAQAADYRIVQAEASLAAARLFYDLNQFARAMRHIDQARSLWGDEPAVMELQKRIEDARFVTK